MRGSSRYLGIIVVAEDPEEFRRYKNKSTSSASTSTTLSANNYKTCLIGGEPHDVTPLAFCGLSHLAEDRSKNEDEIKQEEVARPGLMGVSGIVLKQPIFNQFLHFLGARDVSKKFLLHEIEQVCKFAKTRRCSTTSSS